MESIDKIIGKIDELQLYAEQKARKMGLRKDIKVGFNPRMWPDGSITFPNTDEGAYLILLKKLKEPIVDHELGHAYVHENFPRLERFFDKISKPGHILSALTFRGSTEIYVGLMLTLSFLSLFDGYKNLALISIPGSSILLPYLTEEAIAEHIGRKYKNN